MKIISERPKHPNSLELRLYLPRSSSFECGIWGGIDAIFRIFHLAPALKLRPANSASTSLNACLMDITQIAHTAYKRRASSNDSNHTASPRNCQVNLRKFLSASSNPQQKAPPAGLTRNAASFICSYASAHAYRPMIGPGFGAGMGGSKGFFGDCPGGFGVGLGVGSAVGSGVTVGSGVAVGTGAST